jgi:hypothetical protein
LARERGAEPEAGGEREQENRREVKSEAEPEKIAASSSRSSSRPNQTIRTMSMANQRLEDSPSRR